MRKIFKLLGYLIIIILLAVTGLLIYVKLALPNVGPPEDLNVQSSTERIKRGHYLAHSVCVCMDCHSTRNWDLFSGPLVEGTLGKGGEVFDRKFGFPGTFYSRNLTPAGIGNWSDGELLRAISSGVTKNGRALFPVMPHPNYGKMDKEDLISLIAYLRTLESIENVVPESEPDFPMNFIINTIPSAAQFGKIPDTLNQIEYGKYIFNASACGECHTRQEQGKKVEGMELAGGFEFPLYTGGKVKSANITPDLETGVGKWTEEAFLRRFKSYSDSTYVAAKIEKGNYNTVMPWTMYAGMKEQDLKALFAYLKTVKPVHNSVEKFTK